MRASLPHLASLPLPACPAGATGAHLIRWTGMFSKPMKFISVASEEKPFVLLFSRRKCRSLLVKCIHNGAIFYQHSGAACIEMIHDPQNNKKLVMTTANSWK